MRTLLGLPYNAHTYLLGPIMGQLDLRSQLCIRNFRFLWHAFRSDNNIIYTCINNALFLFYHSLLSLYISQSTQLCMGSW